MGFCHFWILFGTSQRVVQSPSFVRAFGDCYAHPQPNETLSAEVPGYTAVVVPAKSWPPNRTLSRFFRVFLIRIKVREPAPTMIQTAVCAALSSYRPFSVPTDIVWLK
ncbi:unnamed protein product [Pylaiella littoralis]